MVVTLPAAAGAPLEVRNTYVPLYKCIAAPIIGHVQYPTSNHKVVKI